MFRYILQRSLTYLVMVFITTTMGYFAAVTALKPALLEQEKVPKPSPEQVNRNFASLGLDPEMNPLGPLRSVADQCGHQVRLGP